MPKKKDHLGIGFPSIGFTHLPGRFSVQRVVQPTPEKWAVTEDVKPGTVQVQTVKLPEGFPFRCKKYREKSHSGDDLPLQFGWDNNSMTNV